MSYRPSARRSTDTYTRMSHLGLRLRTDEATLSKQQLSGAAAAGRAAWGG